MAGRNAFGTFYKYGSSPSTASGRQYSGFHYGIVRARIRARACTKDFPTAFPSALDNDDAEVVSRIYENFANESHNEEAQLVLDTITEAELKNPNSRSACWLSEIESLEFNIPAQS